MQKSHTNSETLDMIHFHPFRHWKATTEYARNKDLLYVQKLLGHRSIKTKLRYIQLVDVPLEERFISKVAMKVEEEIELIELGFEYVTGEYDDVGKIFRKRRFRIWSQVLAWTVTLLIIYPSNPLF